MKDRLGSFITLVGALALLTVASGFPNNQLAAFFGFLIILIGVGIRVWR